MAHPGGFLHVRSRAWYRLGVLEKRVVMRLLAFLVAVLSPLTLSAQTADSSSSNAQPVAPAGTVVEAAPPPTIWSAHGNVRPRAEFRYNNLFNLTPANARYLRTDNGDLLSLRSRVGLGFKGPKIAGLFQLQHASIWGLTGGDELNDPGVGMHQATVTWSPNDWWWLQIGRFEFEYGDARVLGVGGWNQVGRSWDGVRTGVRLEEDIGLDLFAAMYDDGVLRGSPTFRGRIFEDDALLAGAYFHSDYLWEYLTKIDVYVLGDFRIDELNQRPQRRTLATMGARLANDWVVVEGAYQTGTQCVPDPAAALDCLNVDPVPVSAGFVDTEIGVSLGVIRPFIGGGYATGDNPLTTRQEGYFPMYPRNHRWLGHMDIIGPRTNIIEVRGGADIKIEKLKIREGIHYFHAPQPELEPLGLEFDTSLQYGLHEMLNAAVGYSVFLPFEGMSTNPADDPDGPGSWWYVMLTFDASVALNR